MDHFWRLLVLVYTNRANRICRTSARLATRSERQKYETRITIYMDNDVLETFRERSDSAGKGLSNRAK
jgi:uncharacterized protein (DUF4415 family)